MTEHEPEPDSDVPPDLADQLRQLFADDRLTLPVSPHTQANVVSGARRRRRGRIRLATTGGVLAMVAIISAGALLSGIVHPEHHGVPSATGGAVLSTTGVTTTPPTPTPAVSATTDDSDLVLGPYGVGDLKLGMLWKDALATGDLRESPAVVSAGCLRYTVLIEPDGRTAGPMATTPSQVELVVSVHEGLVEVIGGSMLRTPEGIGVGSSREDLAEAYPKLAVPARGTTSVQAAGNPIARYVFDVSGTGVVTSLSLHMIKSDCLG